MEAKKLDRLFRNGIQDHKILVSDVAWDKLDQMLASKDKRARLLRYWQIGVAASIAMVITFFWLGTPTKDLVTIPAVVPKKISMEIEKPVIELNMPKASFISTPSDPIAKRVRKPAIVNQHQHEQQQVVMDESPPVASDTLQIHLAQKCSPKVISERMPVKITYIKSENSEVNEPELSRRIELQRKLIEKTKETPAELWASVRTAVSTAKEITIFKEKDENN